jgi:acyl-CoA thioester hydrolase
MNSYKPEIRFVDMDAMGHVNNSTYFTYLEQARIDFFRQLRYDKWDWMEEGVVVAKNELNYKVPVFYGDDVYITTQCSHIGTKSLTLSSKVYKKAGDKEILCAEGHCVLVCFNHKIQQSQPMPEAWRAILEEQVNNRS